MMPACTFTFLFGIAAVSYTPLHQAVDITQTAPYKNKQSGLVPKLRQYLLQEGTLENLSFLQDHNLFYSHLLKQYLY